MQLDLYSSAPTAGQPQPLSRFLTQRKVFIKIDDATEYKRCRVQSNRKGVVLRDLAKGAAINTKKQQLCRPGDFLVAEIDAKVGGYGFVPGELDGAIVSSHYYLFEVDEAQLLPRYLYYLTQSDIIQSQISSQGSTNYAAIRPKEFLAIEIPYVEPEQQREIVGRLDAITQETEAFNRESSHQATLLTRLRQAVLREAVQGRLVAQHATDEHATALLARIRVEKQRLIKEKKLRAEKPLPPLSEAEVPYEVPAGWVWERLGNVLLKLTDGTHHSPVNAAQGDFKYVTAKNIRQGRIDLSNITYISANVHNEIYSRCNPELGDVLYIKDGATTGIVAINTLDEPFSMLSSVALLKPPKELYNQYLYFLLSSGYFYDMMRADMSGIAITRVTLTKIAQAPFPLPPLDEQRRIVAKVTKLLAHCTKLEAELGRARVAASALHVAALRETFKEPAVLAAKAEL